MASERSRLLGGIVPRINGLQSIDIVGLEGVVVGRALMHNSRRHASMPQPLHMASLVVSHLASISLRAAICQAIIPGDVRTEGDQRTVE